MLRDAKEAPAIVYLFADNLDAALAAGEDLLKSRLEWDQSDKTSAEATAEEAARVRSALAETRTLEMHLVARTVKARHSAVELGKVDPYLRPVAKLFAAGTAVLASAVEELGDGTATQFDTAGGLTAYLRSRGLLAEDAPAPAPGDLLAVTEDFRVVGRLPLGPLLDLVATTLDTLETYYTLYADDKPKAIAASDESIHRLV